MRRAILTARKRSSYSENRNREKRSAQPGQRLFVFVWMAVFYCCLVALQTLLFVYYKNIGYQLVAYSLIPGVLLGLTLRVFEWFVSLLQGFTTYFMGRLLSGFVLFFVYLIGYIYLFSFIVANPLGNIIQETLGSLELSRDYGLYSVNSIIILAVLSWLKWLQSIAWNPPRQTNKRRQA